MFLKQLCIAAVNDYLLQCTENTEAPSVHCFTETLKTNEVNIPFIGEIPECLKTKKAKIDIISDVSIEAVPCQNPSKEKKIN